MSNPSTQITEYSKTEADLAELKTSFAGMLFECTTSAGMREAKASRMLLVKVRTGLEKIRKEIKGPALNHCQAIDSEARRITSEIHEIEEPITAQIQVEEARQAEIKLKAEREAREAAAKWIHKIAAIKARPLDFIGSPPEDILAAIVKARTLVVTSFPEELQTEARDALDGAICQMEAMHIAALDAADKSERLKQFEKVEDTGGMVESNESEPSNAPSGAVEGVKPDPDSARSTLPPVQDRQDIHPSNDSGAEYRNEVNVAFIDLIAAGDAVVAHYGNFRKPHETIKALEEALNSAKAV